MRVLHIIDHIGTGGAQEIILQLLEGLPKNEIQQDVVYFFNKHHFKNEFIQQGARVTSLGDRTYKLVNFFDIKPVIKLYRLLSINKYDIVHIHLYYSYFLGTLVARLTNCKKIIYTMHAVKDQLPFFSFSLMKLISPFINKFVSEVELSKQELIDLLGEEKIYHIPIGTPTPGKIIIDGKKIRQEFNIKDDAVIVLNIARLHKQKGHHLLLQSFKKILKHNSKAHLIIVGDGKEEQSLKIQAAKLVVQSRVTFTGYRRDLDDFYATADIYAISSLNEALGMVTIQAMIRAKPVVAFDTGSFREVIIDGKTGFLVPPKNINAFADKIIFLSHNRKKAEKIGKQAKIIVEQKFSLHSFLLNYYNLYKNL